MIVIGILLLFGGVALGVTGVVRSLLNITAVARPRLTGGSVGMVLVAFIFMEGLTVTALGEGLFLLSDIANNLPRVQ